MRKWWLALAIGLTPAILCGCIGPQSSSRAERIDELETEVKHERELRAASQKQIDELRSERADLVTKLEEAQGRIQTDASGKPAAFRFVTTKMVIGWMTASVDWDKVGGDDGMQALVQFEDQTGDSVKRAAAFQIELFDVGNEKGNLIETWAFTPEAAAKYWNSIPSGYLFKLPYTKGVPKGKEVVLVAKAQLSEGGDFQAMRTVRVHH